MTIPQPPRFQHTFCQSCGKDCGPGDDGPIDCGGHAHLSAKATAQPIAVGMEAAGVTLARAADFLEWYAAFIKESVMSVDIERHPYLPELEGIAEEVRAMSISAAAMPPLSPPDTGNVGAGWLPIESAPKDGTEILLGATPQTYRGQPVAARSTQGYWDAQKALPSDYASDSGEFIGEPDGVPFWMSQDGGFTEENPPTHWQPMPAPPEFDDPGVATLPPIGTPGYGAALIALAHDHPVTTRKIVRKSNCIAVHEDGCVIGTFAGPDCEAHAAQFAALPPPGRGMVPMSEWQTIETAPKDGTRILLLWNNAPRYGYFLDNSAASVPWAGWRVPSLEVRPSGSPTHWMPLPPPPHSIKEGS